MNTAIDSRPGENQRKILRAYRNYAPIYDLLYGRILQPGRKRTIEHIGFETADNVLEVGVGTGLSFEFYPSDINIHGIDLSSEMLDRARTRKRSHKYSHISVSEMDACSLRFDDNTFDKVIAMYVASVVPEPQKMFSEMVRTCKPGGDIYILNHFQHSNWLVRYVEQQLSRFSGLIGFKTDFKLVDMLASQEVRMVEEYPVNFLGYWKLMHFKNETPGSR